MLLDIAIAMRGAGRFIAQCSTNPNVGTPCMHAWRRVRCRASSVEEKATIVEVDRPYVSGIAAARHSAAQVGRWRPCATLPGQQWSQWGGLGEPGVGRGPHSVLAHRRHCPVTAPTAGQRGATCQELVAAAGGCCGGHVARGPATSTNTPPDPRLPPVHLCTSRAATRAGHRRLTTTAPPTGRRPTTASLQTTPPGHPACKSGWVGVGCSHAVAAVAAAACCRERRSRRQPCEHASPIPLDNRCRVPWLSSTAGVWRGE